jgi:hypothetical protein
MTSEQIVTVIWRDAAGFGLETDLLTLKPSAMRTTGEFHRRTTNGVIIKHPETENTETGASHPKQGTPTYFYIPHATIIEMVKMS